MKSVLIAAGLIIAGTSAASAQYAPRPWGREYHPYAERHHSVCQRKAWELNNYERRAGADGRLSRWERRNIVSLRYDLDRTCGRFRWRG